jgi:putative phage-type endonuclease
MYLYELEDLNNIIDEITYTQTPSIFTEESMIDFIENAFELFNEYITENPTAVSEPDFEETVLEDIKDIYTIIFENHILVDDDTEEDIDDLLQYAWELFGITSFTQRSEAFSIELNINNINNINDINVIINNAQDDFIENQINTLRSMPQPVQRTQEWYTFRHNLITASNAYKAFESQAMQNQLIYEKCQPLKQINKDDDNNNKMVNVNSTLHWGQKYEPVSVMLYEKLYNTTVEDFGCISHPVYKFLGASPDGIVVDKQSSRYGNMLEIKNIVNRPITGIPKKEYWVQMQLQMEVCNLDKCDFLETKFTEYPDETAFYTDTNSNKKGVIVYFNTKENTPRYIYKPLHIIESTDIDNWIEEQISTYENQGLIWIKCIYWKLEQMSCVLVLRNKQWFQDNVKQLEKIWNTILEERISGYQHRAPNRKIKPETTPPITQFINQGCLLKFNSEKYEL